MDAFPDPIFIFAINTQKIRDLRTAEENQSGHTDLDGKKHEKEIRADRSDQTELCKEP